jgi:hypothetical protein
MAEGMFGGVLGGDEDKPEVETQQPLAGAETFAAAVAARLSALTRWAIALSPLLSFLFRFGNSSAADQEMSQAKQRPACE